MQLSQSPTRLTADVLRTTLDNGMTVLVKEIHAAPVTAMSVWVKTGYFHEEDDEVGISHVVEHMFFKGTRARRAPDAIATEIKSLGGELNAGTYYDFTHYFVTLPSAELAKGMEIQADALINPLVDPEELAREIDAIIQEARRKQDSPSAFAREKLNELAFRMHRMRRWRIGEEKSLRSFTREKITDYFDRAYAPENIILSIVGDLGTAEVLEQARRWFGAMPARPARLGSSPPEPPPDGFRFRRLSGDIQRAQMVLAFATVPLFEPDELPVRVLATLLGRGRSSRLVREVKERRSLVDGIGSSAESFRDLGMLTVTAELPAEKLRDAEAAVLGVIEGIRRDGPDPAEIEKARHAVESQYYFGQSDVLGVASTLAYYEALGDYRLADEFVEKLSGVTPEAVHHAARRLLTLDRASLLEYVPDAAGAEERPAAEIRREIEAEAAPTAVSPPPLPGSIRRSPPAAAFSPAERPPRRVALPCGAVLLVEEIPRLPITSVVILFHGGRLQESGENSGVSRLALAVMGKGTVRRDAFRIASEIESLGCSLERIFHDDYLGFSVGILSRFLPGGLDLLFDVLRESSFPGEEVERERRVQLAAIESLPDQAMGYAMSLFREAAFAGHPYALPPFGSAPVVAELGVEDLRRWHRAIFRPDRMVVSVAGDLSADAVAEMVAERMKGWIQEGEAPPDPPVARFGGGLREKSDTRRRAQTFQVIGFPGCDLGSDTKYPLDLLQNAVSGLGGRLFEAVRGKRGLAYVVGASNFARRLGGSFLVYLGTSPENEGMARDIVREEVHRLRTVGPDGTEIARSRSFTLGTYPMLLQSNAARALSYAAAEIQERGMEEVAEYPGRIRAVPDSDVRRVAAEFLDPEREVRGLLRGEG